MHYGYNLLLERGDIAAAQIADFDLNCAHWRMMMAVMMEEAPVQSAEASGGSEVLAVLDMDSVCPPPVYGGPTSLPHVYYSCHP